MRKTNCFLEKIEQDRGNDQPGDRYGCQCTTSHQVTLAMHNGLRNAWVYLPKTGNATQYYNLRYPVMSLSVNEDGKTTSTYPIKLVACQKV